MRKTEIFHKDENTTKISLTSTIWSFAFIAFLLMLGMGILLSIISALFKIDLPGEAEGTAIVGTMLSAQLIINKFYSKHKRLLTRNEYKRISKLGSAAITLLCFPILVLVVFGLFQQGTHSLSLTATLGIIIFAVVFGYILQWIYCCISWKYALKQKLFKLQN